MQLNIELVKIIQNTYKTSLNISTLKARDSYMKCKAQRKKQNLKKISTPLIHLQYQAFYNFLDFQYGYYQRLEIETQVIQIDSDKQYLFSFLFKYSLSRNLRYTLFRQK
ncbi:hypothetical protein pb186bvf_018786 [Paramecium bursaria]